MGQKIREILTRLMAAVYQAREGPGEDLVTQYEPRLGERRTVCEQHRHAQHEKTQALAREFLNDWEAIFQVLAHPSLPLTNNEAERALRHWVIARKLSYGTRSEQGTRAFGLLASIIETCRKRNVSPWAYLLRVIAARRQGCEAPPIPAAA